MENTKRLAHEYLRGMRAMVPATSKGFHQIALARVELHNNHPTKAIARIEEAFPDIMINQLAGLISKGWGVCIMAGGTND